MDTEHTLPQKRSYTVLANEKFQEYRVEEKLGVSELRTACGMETKEMVLTNLLYNLLYTSELFGQEVFFSSCLEME